MQCGRVGRRLLSEPSPGHFTVAGALCVWGEEGEGEGRRGDSRNAAVYTGRHGDGGCWVVGDGRWRLWGRWVEYKWICLDNIGESLNFVRAWKALHDCIAA